MALPEVLLSERIFLALKIAETRYFRMPFYQSEFSTREYKTPPLLWVCKVSIPPTSGRIAKEILDRTALPLNSSASLPNEMSHNQPCYFQICRNGRTTITDSVALPCKQCPQCLCGNYCRSCGIWTFYGTPNTSPAPSSDTLCDVCRISSNSNSCISCHWTFGLEGTSRICWWCKKKGVKSRSILTQQIYYCYICHAEMYPPTSESRPMHGRICHICEVFRQSQRTKFGNERASYCRKCDFALKSGGKGRTCVLCAMEEEALVEATTSATFAKRLSFGKLRQTLSGWWTRALSGAQYTNRPRRYSITRQ